MVLRIILFLSLFTNISLLSAQWTQKANAPVTPRRNTTGFSINGKGYLVLGGLNSTSPTHYQDLQEYDLMNGTWSTKTSFPGTARRGGVAAFNDTMVIVGMGWDNSTVFKDLYRYFPSTDTWVSITNYPGSGGREVFAVIANGKLYMGAGESGITNFYNDFWEFNFSTNTWTQKNNIPFSSRFSGVYFSHGNNIYFG